MGVPVESIKKILIWAWNIYPWLWKRLLPDPSTSDSTPSRRDQRQRRVDKWRAAWRWAGIGSVIYPIIAGNDVESKYWFLNLALSGIVATSLTVYLVTQFPVGDFLTSWRLSLCGAICICFPFLISLAAWWIIETINLSLHKNLALPFYVPLTHKLNNLATCLVFTLINHAFVKLLPQPK
jgi:hypothetical protein